MQNLGREDPILGRSGGDTGKHGLTNFSVKLVGPPRTCWSVCSLAQDAELNFVQM
jgi:hypothetical protein